jgi:hypothetical protein
MAFPQHLQGLRSIYHPEGHQGIQSWITASSASSFVTPKDSIQKRKDYEDSRQEDGEVPYDPNSL